MHVINFPRERYLGGYDDITRWNSYWYQIECVRELSVENILEIGIGNKTVSNYLKNQGYNITTLDINKNLRPMIVGEITQLPFISDKFDVTLCCEVLEHIPFDKVEKALREMRRISKYIIISLPHFTIYISITMDTNIFSLTKQKRFEPRNLLIRLPLPLRQAFDGAHYWEIGKRGYTIKTIKKMFRKQGLKLLKEKIPLLNPPHHFFVLQRAQSTRGQGKQ